MADLRDSAAVEKGGVVDGNGSGISPSDSNEKNAIAVANPNDPEAPSRIVSSARQSMSDIFTIVRFWPVLTGDTPHDGSR
jgi:hypothetical protein